MGQFLCQFTKQQHEQRHLPEFHIAYSEGCINLANKPTHITTQSSTLLDHIYTNVLNEKIESGLLTYDVFDHLPTFCFMPHIPKLRYEKRVQRITKNFNSDMFLLNIKKMFSELESNQTRYDWDSEQTTNSFIEAFTALINTHLPLIVQSKRASKLTAKSWITKGILKSVKTKNKLFSKCYKQQLIKHY